MRLKILFAAIAILFACSSHAQRWEELNNQVLSFLGKGDYKNALVKAHEARNKAREEFGENHADYSASLHNLASAHKKLGEYTSAESLYWEALKIDKRVLGVKHQNYALSLFGLANLYKLKKEFTKAESIYKDALDIMEKAVSNQHPDYALILGDFADLQTEMQDFKKAGSNLRRARNTTKYTVGVKHQDYAMILFYYGKLYKTKGNIAKAEKSLEMAMELFRKTVGTQHPDFKDCERYFNNLYNPKFELYKAAPSEIVFKKEDGGGNSKKFVRSDTTAIANLTKEEIDEDDAFFDEDFPQEKKVEEEFKPVVTPISQPPRVKKEPIKKEVPPPAPAAKTWSDFSMLMDKHTQRGRYNDAIMAGEKAIKLVRNEFGEDHENYTWISLKLADSYENAGMLDRAIPLYEQDLAQIEKNIGRDNMTYKKRRDELLKAYEETGQKDKVRQFYKKSIYSSFSKFNAASLLEQNRMMEKMQSETEEYYSNSKDLGYLVTGTEMQNMNLALKGRDTDAALGIEFPMTGSMENYQNQLRDKLKNNEAAIDFLRMKNPETQQGNYYAIVTVKSKSESVLVPLLEEAKINMLLNAQADSPESYIQDLDRSYQLFQLIWEPLETHLKGVNFVHVSTVGVLNKIAFNGLVDYQKNSLADKYEIYYYSTLRDFINDKNTTNRNEVISFFGGVDFGSGTLNYLPATKDEVNTFKVVCSAKGWAVDTKISGDASERNLKALSGNSPGILHLATPVYFQHLEEYSGIALSGANAKINSSQFADNKNDGLLSAKEIAKLDLSKTNLVLLSACETGSDKNSAKGILSLQRALKAAGVDTILFSQWKIPEKQVQEFLALFYINHLTGMDTHKAFSTAQKDIRKLYNSPYYWAGFILIE